MDGERGDDDVLFAHIGLGDEHTLFFPHDAPRDLQRAVEEGVIDAAAVRFDVEPREGAVRKGGVFFELEGGRVGVRGDDLEGAFGAFPDAEGDERAAAPRDKILLAAAKIPFLALRKGAKTVRREKGGGVLNGLKGGV